MKRKIFLYGMLLYVLCSLFLLKIQLVKPSNNQYDCIVVLGNSPNAGNTPNPFLKQRLDEGIRYLNSGFSNKIILTGAAKKPGYSEAGIMKLYSLKNGVAENSIILEESAKSTIENLRNSNSIMKSLNLKTGLVVTSVHHTNRTRAYCKQLNLQNLEVVGSEYNFITLNGLIPLTIMEKIKMN